jgi:outer membrane protein
MNIMRKISLLLNLSAALLLTQIGHADDLMAIYERAMRSDPSIREADANRLATLESKPQAVSALLPQLSAGSSYGYNQADGTRIVTIPDATNNALIEATSPFDQDSTTLRWNVDLRQSVFNWDRWVTLKTADKQVAQAEADYRSAEQDLMVRVATAYFDVLAAEDTLESEQAAKEAIARQLEQANKRFEVGLIAITDVQEAQSAFDTATAAEILAKRNLASSKEFLREIVGEIPEKLNKPKEEIPLVNPEPAVEDEWVTTAMQKNLSLLSSEIAAEISRDNVAFQRTGHYPTIELVGSYNSSDAKGDSAAGVRDPADPTGDLLLGPPQTADNDRTGYDISLQLSVPLYSGGNVSSRTQQAVYEHRAARERFERTARQTERETRDAYLGVVSEIARVKALKQARKSARTALQATEAGFDVGTRTTVDVLEQRRQLFAADVNYARSRYDYIINVLLLKQAAGGLMIDDLVEVNGWLEQ